MEVPKNVRVCTINVWGLPDLFNGAPNKIKRLGHGNVGRRNRMKNIGERFNDFDIICLQEVWLFEDRKFFINKANKSGLIYWHSFPSGRLFNNRFIQSIPFLCESENHASPPQISKLGIGSGTIIFSRFPIINSHFSQFSLCGKPFKIYHGIYSWILKF